MKPLTCFLALLLALGLNAQDQPEPYRLVFYNVENLFHPSEDSLVKDEEFRPEAPRHWTYARYYAKLNRIAKALLSVQSSGYPDLIALAEVEDERVLRDLRTRAPLRKAQYEMAYFPSPDHRGTDLACLYRPEKLFLIDQAALPLRSPQDSILPTRSMGALRFMVRGGDTLALLFCHWPSRYGGQKASELKRLWAAQQVVRHWRQIEQNTARPLWLMLGDLNDGPRNKSVALLREAGLTGLIPTGAQKASHKYRGEWLLLDQAWASLALLKKARQAALRVHDPEFLLEEDGVYGGMKPRRTYLGYRHQAGFSDHLPIVVELNW